MLLQLFSVCIYNIPGHFQNYNLRFVHFKNILQPTYDSDL